jgi:hypothetical protein
VYFFSINFTPVAQWIEHWIPKLISANSTNCVILISWIVCKNCLDFWFCLGIFRKLRPWRAHFGHNLGTALSLCLFNFQHQMCGVFRANQHPIVINIFPWRKICQLVFKFFSLLRVCVKVPERPYTNSPAWQITRSFIDPVMIQQ